MNMNISGDMGMNMNSDIISNMGMNNLEVNPTTPVINPSNNFLLYYYVEYM